MTCYARLGQNGTVPGSHLSGTTGLDLNFGARKQVPSYIHDCLPEPQCNDGDPIPLLRIGAISAHGRQAPCLQVPPLLTLFDGETKTAVGAANLEHWGLKGVLRTNPQTISKPWGRSRLAVKDETAPKRNRRYEYGNLPHRLLENLGIDPPQTLFKP